MSFRNQTVTCQRQKTNTEIVGREGRISCRPSGSPHLLVTHNAAKNATEWF